MWHVLGSSCIIRFCQICRRNRVLQKSVASKTKPKCQTNPCTGVWAHNAVDGRWAVCVMTCSKWCRTTAPASAAETTRRRVWRRRLLMTLTTRCYCQTPVMRIDCRSSLKTRPLTTTSSVMTSSASSARHLAANTRTLALCPSAIAHRPMS